MSEKRSVKIYSAGCCLCSETVERVKEIACGDCEITVRDMSESKVSGEARKLGIETFPAVVIDGKLVSCCNNTGIDEEALRSAGLGKPL